MANSRSRSPRHHVTNGSRPSPSPSRTSDTWPFDFEGERAVDKVKTKQHQVFAWLRWSPAFKSPCYNALHRFFPGALPAQAVQAKIDEVLIRPEYKMTPDNTLFGTASCPDEINLKEKGLIDLMERRWGEQFPLGGISGVPFAGKTGFAAFSAHVPDDGNVIVLFGPHVGISTTGEVGKVLRQGQAKESGACGAVVGAYNACIKEHEEHDFHEKEFDATDMQMDWIKKKLDRYADNIKLHEDPMAFCAHHMSRFVEQEVLRVVNTKFGSGRLVLIGGIMINMPNDMPMHFLPQMFQVRRQGEEHRDHLSVFNCRVTDPVLTRAGVAEDDRINFWAKIINEIEVFKKATFAIRKEVASTMTQMDFTKGEQIITQGEIGNTMFVIVSGEVDFFIDGKFVRALQGFLDVDGCLNSQVQKLLEAETMPHVNCFGEAALLSDNPRGATAVVKSSHVICSIMSREAFNGLKSNQNLIVKDQVVDGNSCSFSFARMQRQDAAMGTAHHLFHYLRWSPSFDSKAYRALHENFPGSLPAPVILRRSLKALTKPRFGLTPANTIFGTSICPDEINSLPGTLSALLRKHWGKSFPLGGISGIPFAGKTGFVAFSHHVPDDGNVIVLFGPHVGIAEDGRIGTISRRGQKNITPACGAVVGAYSACKDSSFTHAEFDDADMQMCFIKDEIAPHVERIKNFREPMALLAHYAYEMVKSKVFEVSNTDFGRGYLVLIGGIQINMPACHREHFLPLTFQVSRAGEDGYTDLMEVFSIHDSMTASGT